MEHLGIDVHKVESQICILTESGEVVERRIRTQRERFAAVLGERPRARVLIEASTESEWVARCLEELGHEVVVADPNFAAMYATRSRKVKTDLRDARTLAEACKLGAYRAAHRTSDRQRHVRTQLSDAGGAGADESALHLADQCPAAARGPARRERECGEFVRRVAKLALPGQLKSEIAPLLAVFVSVDRQLAWIDTRLEHLARTDETVERLCTAPSVGPVTAAAFSTTVDDPRRFKSAHQWRPIWGSPEQNGAPGRSKARGTSPKAGNNRMRKLLVQVAVSILRLRSPRTEALRKWATGIAVRRGRKIAIVALARRMAGVLLAMMRDRTCYLQPALLAPAAQLA